MRGDLPPEKSGDEKVLAPYPKAFQPNGGIRLLAGNIGSAIIKVSAVKPENRVIEAPARIFHDQEELNAAFKAGTLDGDMIAVVRYQGPKANGMPELHRLTHRARHPPGSRPQGRIGHGRAHVGRFRQGTVGDPRDAGGT